MEFTRHVPKGMNFAQWMEAWVSGVDLWTHEEIDDDEEDDEQNDEED